MKKKSIQHVNRILKEERSCSDSLCCLYCIFSSKINPRFEEVEAIFILISSNEMKQFKQHFDCSANY